MYEIQQILFSKKVKTFRVYFFKEELHVQNTRRVLSEMLWTTVQYGGFFIN